MSNERTRSPSQTLKDKLALVLPLLGTARKRFHEHPRIGALYPDYLFVMYSIVRATVPVMQHALARCLELAAQDAIAEKMIPFLEKHIREENHAHWVLEDAEVLGIPRAEMLRRTPPAAIAALVGSQYYWIDFAHPVALLGHIQVMEGYPPTSEQIDTLITRTGHPRSAFRSLERHGAIDAHHKDELCDVIDNLPLDRHHERLIGVNALASVELACEVITNMVDEFETRFEKMKP